MFFLQKVMGCTSGIKYIPSSKKSVSTALTSIAVIIRIIILIYNSFLNELSCASQKTYC